MPDYARNRLTPLRRGGDWLTTGPRTSAECDRTPESAWCVYVALRLGTVWLLFLLVGTDGGLLGWRGGAFFMLAWAGGSFTGHLIVGVSEYRRVMRRPWPKVEPLTDDDW